MLNFSKKLYWHCFIFWETFHSVVVVESHTHNMFPRYGVIIQLKCNNDSRNSDTDDYPSAYKDEYAAIITQIENRINGLK